MKLDAQSIDSLKILFSKPDISDSIKLEIFNKIKTQIIVDAPQDAYNLSKQAIKIAQNQNNRKEVINALITFGIVNKKIGNYEKSAQSYFKALKEIRKLDDISLESICLNNLANVYQEQGYLTKALDMYLESLAIERKLNNKKQISLRYYNIGAVYEVLDSLDKAFTYYMNSLLIEQEINNKEGIYFSYYGLAGVERNRKKMDAALQYLYKALAISISLNDVSGEAICYNEIAKCYHLLEQKDSSLYFFNLSNTKAKTINYQVLIKDNSYELAQLFYEIGAYKQAFENQTEYILINDTINNIEINSKIAEIETKFELELKEETIQTLEQTSKIQNRFNIYMLVSSLLLMFLALSNLFRIVENWYNILFFSIFVFLLIGFASWIVAIKRSSITYPELNQVISASFDVIAISILPIFTVILVYERIMLNKRLKTAQELSKSIEFYRKNDNQPTEVFYAENKKDSISLDLSQILFIEANDNYSMFYYIKENNLTKEMIRGNLKSMQEQIKSDILIRCHKSYIVNLSKIKNVQGNAKGFKLQFDLVNFEIPVSRSFPKSVIEKIQKD
ncbi:MAG: tetratricopeptide repeat protein [Bacteroidales bacterium]|nr:tetratricopeptide repeat protein [Bacteroidales bacterium]